MNIIFCGSGDFGIALLNRLATGDEHTVARIYTQPPRPAGRGGKLHDTPLAQAAQRLGLPAVPVADINAPAVQREIAALSADVMVVADFGQKVGQAVRDSTRLGAFNLHGSTLPALRGAGPVAWAIIRGFSETGVTTFRMVDKMDAGEVFVIRRTLIDPAETAEELRHRLSELGVSAMLETLEMLAAGRTAGDVQDESKKSLAPRLKKSDGLINWCADAVAIRNQIHGTWPWPGGHTRYESAAGKSQDVLIARARALPVGAGDMPGMIGADLTVATGNGRIEMIEIKPAGGRLMAWKDFVNGHRVSAGCRFVTLPPE